MSPHEPFRGLHASTCCAPVLTKTFFNTNYWLCSAMLAGFTGEVSAKQCQVPDLAWHEGADLLQSSPPAQSCGMESTPPATCGLPEQAEGGGRRCRS